MDVQELYRPTLTAKDDARAQAALLPPRDSWIVRVAFGLLALVAIGMAFAPRRENHSAEEWVLLVVISGGVAFASLGMVVPWYRIAPLARRLHAPGRYLGFLSRFVGWFGFGALPAVALGAPWWVLPLVALAPVATIGLWLRRSWAVWPWYLVALACAALGAVKVAHVVIDTYARMRGEAVDGRGLGGAFAGLLLVSLGVYVARETRLFQKSLNRP
jgi:hypothetical protein